MNLFEFVSVAGAEDCASVAERAQAKREFIRCVILWMTVTTLVLVLCATVTLSL